MGRFSRKRSMVCSICSVVTVLPAGYFITLWGRWHGQDSPYGYFIVFAIGAVAGILSLAVSYKIPKRISTEHPEKMDGKLADFIEPFKNQDFVTILSTGMKFTPFSRIKFLHHRSKLVGQFEIKFTSATVSLQL